MNIEEYDLDSLRDSSSIRDLIEVEKSIEVFDANICDRRRVID